MNIILGRISPCIWQGWIRWVHPCGCYC